MANRYYKSQFRYSFDVKPVDLSLKVTIGASGAPTIDAANSIGISSITRNSAGDYTVKMQDPYYTLRGVDCVIDTTGTAAVPAAPFMYVAAQSVSAAGGGTVEVVFCAASGASGALVATDPADGEVIYLHLSLNDSSVTY